MATDIRKIGAQEEPLNYDTVPANGIAFKASGRLVAIAVGCLVAIGFVLGRMSTAIHWPTIQGLNPSGDIPRTLQDEERDYSSFVNIWNQFVVSRDGYIPADPYRALVDSRAVDSYANLQQFDFVMYLPPRINPVLRLNPHKAIVYWPRPDRRENWIVFADGTWEREPDRETQLVDNWFRRLHELGYPNWDWKTAADQDKWVAANRDRLVWDAAVSAYAVRPEKESHVTTRPAGSLSG